MPEEPYGVAQTATTGASAPGRKEMSKPTDLKAVVDMDAKVLDIRQSSIQEFLDCRRRFYWNYIVGIEYDYTADDIRPWATADTGTAVHVALGAYYADDNWHSAVNKWVDKQWPDGLPAGHKKDLVMVMVEGHLDDLAEDGADIGETTVSIEEAVCATIEDIHGWTVNVHGRVDRRIETEDGIKIIDDWKTVGPLTSTLDYIQQLGRYAVLIRAATGWRADRVRTTQIRKLMRTKAGPFYGRPWVALNEDAYASHAANLRHQLVDMVTVIENDGPWYEHVTGECSWKCRNIQDICKAQQQGDDPELIVQIHFRDKVPR